MNKRRGGGAQKKWRSIESVTDAEISSVIAYLKGEALLTELMAKYTLNNSSVYSFIARVARAAISRGRLTIK